MGAAGPPARRTRWLRANAATYNLDPNRIAVWGESAGALMANLLGLTEGNAQLEDLSQGNAAASSKVQAVVIWYGGASLLNNTTPPEDTLGLLGCDPRHGIPYVVWTNEMSGIGQWLDGVLR